MHGLDDVAADREVAQRVLDPGLERPAAGRHLFGKPEPFELCGPADQQPPQFRVFVRSAGTKIGDAGALVGGVAECAVETGPAVGLHLLLQGGADLVLAARPQLQGDPLGGAVAKAPADVVAADHQVLAVIGSSADEDMDVWIVRVPVIDGDPIEPGAEIAFGVGHQLAGEGAQAFQLGGILRRDDETKVVPVILAALREGPLVGHLGPRRRTCGRRRHRG